MPPDEVLDEKSTITELKANIFDIIVAQESLQQKFRDFEKTKQDLVEKLNKIIESQRQK